MTVSTTATRIAYTGNASTTAFAFSFRFLATTDIAVYLNGVLQSTGYTVSSPGASGTVTFSTAPASGVSVVITRATAKTQETDYVANDAFSADSTELAFDRAMLAAQDNAAGLGRALRVADYLPAINPISDPSAPVLAWANYPINVKAYGAKGDGVTNDTAAIQAACDAAAAQGGGIVFMPEGRYVITSGITIANTMVTLAGEGIDATIIRQTGSTAHGVNFNYPISFGLPTGGGVRDLTIEAGAGFASGAFYGIGSSGTGIRVKNASDNFCVFNVSVHNFDRSAHLLHCWNTRWSNFRFLYANTALELDLDGTNIGAGNTFSFCKISNLGFTGTVATSIGVRVRASGGEFFSFGDVTSFGRGTVVDPATGSQQVLYLDFSEWRCDTCVSHGFEFDGSAKNVWSVRLTGCFGAFNGGSGLHMTGANVDSIRWIGGALRENELHGARLDTGVKNCVISGAEIASNSRLSAGTNHGVSVAAGVSLWAVTSCTIGNYASSTANQQNGVNIASGASTNFRVSDNTFTGNLGTNISNGSSSLLYEIRGNLPLQVNESNPSGAQSLSSGTAATVAPASTVYLGPGGVAASFAQDNVWIINKPGLIRRMYVAVNTAPGAGETFTYTVMKNGSATSMAGTISGASSFSVTVLTNLVSVDLNDNLSIRLVTSAAAGFAKHRYFLSVE